MKTYDALLEVIRAGDKARIGTLAVQLPAKDLSNLILSTDDVDVRLALLSSLIAHPAPGNRAIIANTIRKAIHSEEQSQELLRRYDSTGTKRVPRQVSLGLSLAKRQYAHTPRSPAD